MLLGIQTDVVVAIKLDFIPYMVLKVFSLENVILRSQSSFANC